MSGGAGSPGTAYSCSPETCRAPRLVATIVRPGQARRSCATSGAAAITCSKLSRTSRQVRGARCSTSSSRVGRTPLSVSPTARAMRARHESRLGERLERDEPRPVRIPVRGRRGDLERQARLADPAGSGEREQARRVEEQERGGQVVVAADERRQLGRQVVRLPVERADGREVGRHACHDQLRQAFRPEVLEAVLAEVADRHVRGQRRRDQRAGRLGDQDLAAVARGGDARGPVDLERRVVPARGWGRLARVEPHPDADLGVGRPRMRRERALRRDGRRRGRAGAGERHEERVALRLHLHAAVRREGCPQDRAVSLEEGLVGAAQARDQLGGALDVGEEERDRPRGERPPRAEGRGLGGRFHGPMLRQRAAPVNAGSRERERRLQPVGRVVRSSPKASPTRVRAPVTASARRPRRRSRAAGTSTGPLRVSR